MGARSTDGGVYAAGGVCHGAGADGMRTLGPCSIGHLKNMSFRIPSPPGQRRSIRPLALSCTEPSWMERLAANGGC